MSSPNPGWPRTPADRPGSLSFSPRPGPPVPGPPAQGPSLHRPSGYWPGSPGTGVQASPPWPVRARPSGVDALGVFGVLAAAALTVGALTVLALLVGPGAAVMGGALALLPLAVVLLAIRWLDRWEPEPPGALWFALLWGAGASVIAALIGNEIGAGYVAGTGVGASESLVLTASVVAPVVEETAKAAGLLLLFLARRRYFDGPVDGLVYAATIAAGFAFSENILYFGRASEDLAAVFVVRAVFSPFAHVLFTACVGLALGAASRYRSGRAVVIAFPIGLLGAIALHGLWNASASLGADFILVYVVVQVPLFLATIGLVVWLRRLEARVVRLRLGEYATAGWFSTAEVRMLSSMSERRRARAWARSHGPAAHRAMRSFQHHATDLAYLRQRASIGRSDLGGHQDEAVLLADLARDRSAFLGAAAARAAAGSIGPRR